MRILLLLSIVLCSCSAAHDLRKAKRLIAKAKMKGVEVKIDTVYVDKTVIVPGEKTTVQLPGTHSFRVDTVYRDRNGIVIHVKRDTIRETIQVECPNDTVKIQVPVTVHESIICPPPSHFWRTVALVLAVLLAILYGLSRLKLI